MRRLVLPGIAVIAAVALIALLAFGVADQGTNTSIDSALAHGKRPAVPNARMALPVLGSARKATVAGFNGQIVVLNVFASWCGPCKAEAPILDQAQRLLTRHDGTVLGVAYLDNSSDSEAFVRSEHITFPVVRDISETFVHALGTTAVPETFVIDRSGRIAAVRRYQLTGTWLEQTITRLLHGESA